MGAHSYSEILAKDETRPEYCKKASHSEIRRQTAFAAFDMAPHSRPQSCEHIAGLLLGDQDFQQRGWTHQYLWGLDLDGHVITKMLTERLGQQGFGLYLVEGDLYKIWAPSHFEPVRTFSFSTTLASCEGPR